MTTPAHAPLTQGELELYRVLHRANLLQYYDTFISQGGDDVQQLCEAGEEEFLEIMALVGMAAKPLHVRRLQKALQEWVANPALFAQMIPSSSSSSVTSTPSTGPKGQGLITVTTTPAQQTSTSTNTASTLSPGTGSSGTVTAQTWMPMSSSSDSKGFTAISATSSNGGGSIKDELIEKPSSPMPQIALMDNQLLSIEECARELVKTLPPYSPKPLSMKKQINQDIMNVISIDYDDPMRMDEIRKYSAIYGRFDSKRKNLKPMSLHEICVNEAAAQICRYIPNLLTRRDELFPLARQVVRDSGYQYSKGHSRTCDTLPGTGGAVKKSTTPLLPLTPGQIAKMGPDELDKAQVRLLAERMAELTQDLAAILQQQELVKSKMTEAKEESNLSLVRDLQGELELLTAKQLQLLAEQSQIIKTQRRSDRYYTLRGANENGDGTDSMHSGASSPQSSCISEETDYKQSDFYTSPPKKNAAKTKIFVQKSLFDEGLRIAQQYGMADFAEEIVDMKSVKKENEDEVDCDDEEVDSYNNDFRPVRVKKESSDDEGEKMQHRYGDQNGQGLNLKRSLDNDDGNIYNSHKYSCGVHGLKVEKLKVPLHANSGDESLYQSEESCDSRVDIEVGPNRPLDNDYSTGANNNLKSEVSLQGGHLVNNGQ
ncbi:NGFI-A-binding protein 1-like isoform X2 [Lineus longissimus]